MDSAGTMTQLCLLLLLKRRARRAQVNSTPERAGRRWWVRPINLDREKKGEFRRIMVEMKLHDHEWFFMYTRMTPEVFDNLLNLVGPALKKNSIRTPICPSQRLAITLRFLATGDSYFSIANSYHLGKSTVCVIITEVISIIWDVLSPIVLPQLTEQILKNIADDFLEVWNIPHCVGSIDGKHIKITAPAKSGSLYYNYKGHFSIILMGICDADYNFTHVDVGAYGSISDGGVFGTSRFGEALQTKTIPLPRPQKLPGSNIDMTHFFVGDAAFPLGDNLMRPYSGRTLNVVKAVFNYRLSRARRVIENTFGIMAARWRIFHRTICASPTTADNIVKATTCLHNFIRRSLPARERYIPPHYIDSDDVLGKWRLEVEGSIIETCPRLGSNNATYNANNYRNNLAKYFLTPAGFKDGQIEYVKRT